MILADSLNRQVTDLCHAGKYQEGGWHEPLDLGGSDDELTMLLIKLRGGSFR